jgi:hypothetical protein
LSRPVRNFDAARNASSIKTRAAGFASTATSMTSTATAKTRYRRARSERGVGGASRRAKEVAPSAAPKATIRYQKPVQRLATGGRSAVVRNTAARAAPIPAARNPQRTRSGSRPERNIANPSTGFRFPAADDANAIVNRKKALPASAAGAGTFGIRSSERPAAGAIAREVLFGRSGAGSMRVRV